MAKNPVNDNGLENNVPEAIRCWYKDIETEISSARKCGYTEDEIIELMGDVAIPSWYFIVKNIDRWYK